MAKQDLKGISLLRNCSTPLQAAALVPMLAELNGVRQSMIVLYCARKLGLHFDIDLVRNSRNNYKTGSSYLKQERSAWDAVSAIHMPNMERLARTVVVR